MCFAEKVLNNNIQQEDPAMGRTTVIIPGSGGAQGGSQVSCDSRRGHGDPGLLSIS